MSRFSSISEALDLLVGPCVVEPNWDEIMRRAAPETQVMSRRRRSRPSRRAALAVAVAAVAVLAAAAFASGLADRFSSWINGKPGEPASVVEQRGFAARNGVSLAAFPAGTKLRLLLRRTVSGTSFDLLGFRLRVLALQVAINVFVPTNCRATSRWSPITPGSESATRRSRSQGSTGSPPIR
jgi:hypothetical protein